MVKKTKITILVEEDRDGLDFEYDIEPPMHIAKFVGVLRLVEDQAIKRTQQAEVSYIG